MLVRVGKCILVVEYVVVMDVDGSGTSNETGMMSDVCSAHVVVGMMVVQIIVVDMVVEQAVVADMVAVVDMVVELEQDVFVGMIVMGIVVVVGMIVVE